MKMGSKMGSALFFLKYCVSMRQTVLDGLSLYLTKRPRVPFLMILPSSSSSLRYRRAVEEETSRRSVASPLLNFFSSSKNAKIFFFLSSLISCIQALYSSKPLARTAHSTISTSSFSILMRSSWRALISFL